MWTLNTHWEYTLSVYRCGPAPRGSSPGTCPGEGRNLLGSVCRSSCWSRSRTPTCTLTEKHRPTASVYLTIQVIDCVLRVKYTGCQYVFMCACLTGNKVKNIGHCSKIDVSQGGLWNKILVKRHMIWYNVMQVSSLSHNAIFHKLLLVKKCVWRYER